MRQDTLEQLISETKPVLMAIELDPTDPNQQVASQLENTLEDTLLTLQSTQHNDDTIDLETNVDVLVALQEAYLRSRGISPHAFLPEKTSQPDRIHLKAIIANIAKIYFNNGEPVNNTTLFLARKLEETKSQLGWILPREPQKHTM